MNILYLINHAGNGGSENYVYNLAQSMQKEHSVFFAYNVEGKLSEKMREICRAVLKLKMSSPFDIAAAVKLAGFMKKHRIDIVHAQYQRENFIAIIARLLYHKPRIVYTSHLNTLDSAMRKFVNRIVTKGDSALIAVCSLGEKLLKENGYPKSKIHLIFNGAKKPENIIERQKEKGEAFVFLCLARLSEEKGMFFLLDSVTEAKKKAFSTFKLLLAGDGPLRNELTAYADKLDISDTVSFLGFVSNTDKLFEQADVCINSSPMEALSLALTEALAYSLPLIVTAVGGNIDIVNEKTGCGIAVGYNDTEAMANAMLTLMKDNELRKTCADNARETFEAHFNIEKMIARTKAVYDAALKNNVHNS